MKTVPIRELQQHSSAVVRRVRAGETVGITDRGKLVAVMSPPSAVGGVAALTAGGHVRPAEDPQADLPPPVGPPPIPTAELIDDLRADR